MTRGQMRSRVQERVEEVTGVPTYYTAAEVNDGLNEGQQLFVFMTLCLESTVTFVLRANRPISRLRPYFPDFLLPLKLTVGGARIRPARLDDLDGLNLAWQSNSGAPAKYAQLGFTMICSAAQPGADTDSQLTYARQPAAMVSDSDSPEIPDAYHEALIDYASYYVRVKEGGAALSRGADYYNRFLDEAKVLAAYVRARSLAGKYDRLPPEVAFFDMSRMVLPKKDLASK